MGDHSSMDNGIGTRYGNVRFFRWMEHYSWKDGHLKDWVLMGLSRYLTHRNSLTGGDLLTLLFFPFMTLSLFDRFRLFFISFIGYYSATPLIPFFLVSTVFFYLDPVFSFLLYFLLSHFGLIGIRRRYAKEWSMD